MVDRLVAVDDADYRLPEPVRQALATDATNSGTELGGVLASMVARRTIDVVADFGAVGDGVADDTAAIQAAIDAAAPGQAIVFPQTGAAAWYKITDTLTVITPGVRFVGQPRDGYAVSIRCSVASKTMLTVKATGFVAQDIAFLGDTSEVNGNNGTVTGVDLFGNIDADIDADLTGCTFQGCAVGVILRGRNATVRGSLFSNCLNGIRIVGPDGTYHTGPAASQNRGNRIIYNRFHNLGAASTDAAIHATTTAAILHAQIDQNYFDSNGLGVHVYLEGAPGAVHQRVSMIGNKHTELLGVAYKLTYVNNSFVESFAVDGNTGTFSGNAIELRNCINVQVDSGRLYQIGVSGIYARNCQDVAVTDVKMRSLGLSASTGHGIDADGTNTAMTFDNVKVHTTDGAGLFGNPASSSMSNCDFQSCTGGRINSTTVVNTAAATRNRFIEGRDGRIEDAASKPFDLTVAAGATDIATVLSGHAFSSFAVDVEIVGRNSTGPIYARYRRYVRPENGSPVFVTPVADHASGTITVAFVASGTTGVKVQATVTGVDAFVTAHVRAVAGGGADTSHARSVTVTML